MCALNEVKGMKLIMKKYYYNSLSKEEKKKVQEKYKKDYQHSDFEKRITRLVIYSVVAFLFGLFLIIYSLVRDEDLISNLLVAIPLFIAAIILLIGRYYAKLMVLNKIALKEKN